VYHEETKNATVAGWCDLLQAAKPLWEPPLASVGKPPRGVPPQGLSDCRRVQRAFTANREGCNWKASAGFPGLSCFRADV